MIAHSFRGSAFGPAQALHGATFVVDAAFMAETLDTNGTVIDIGRAHELLKGVLAPLNYKNLDDVPEFKNTNTPTARPSFSPSIFTTCSRRPPAPVNWVARGANSKRSALLCRSHMWPAPGTRGPWGVGGSD